MFKAPFDWTRRSKLLGASLLYVRRRLCRPSHELLDIHLKHAGNLREPSERRTLLPTKHVPEMRPRDTSSIGNMRKHDLALSRERTNAAHKPTMDLIQR